MGLPTTTVYTSVTRSRYSNVVNTANQIGARNTELMYEEVCVTRVSFFYGAGMDVWTNGGRLLLECTATTVVSADPSAKQHRRVLH
jgi:hypothetical protein